MPFARLPAACAAPTLGACLLLALAALPASAAEYPAAKESYWTARDFRFHTGEVMPELRLHYRTVGEPNGEPVLILHGESDTVIPVSHARSLHEAAPQSELHTFACGHNDCARPGALLRAFLSRHGVI